MQQRYKGNARPLQCQRKSDAEGMQQRYNGNAGRMHGAKIGAEQTQLWFAKVKKKQQVCKSAYDNIVQIPHRIVQATDSHHSCNMGAVSSPAGIGAQSA